MAWDISAFEYNPRLPGAGSVTLTGYAPTVVVEAGVTAITRSPGLGSLALTTYAPVPLVEHYRATSVGSLNLSGQAPVVRQDHVRTTGAGSLTATGGAPQARQDMWRVPGAGSVTLTGTTPAQVWYWYQPYQYTRTVGDLDGGAFEDVWTTNGQELVIGEVSGTPGFDVEFDWRSLPTTATGLEIHGYYDGPGAGAHTVQVQRWNGSGWDVLGTMPRATSAQDYWFVLPEATTHTIRFYHVEAGNPTHQLHLDQLAIWQNRYQSDSGSLTLTGYAPAVVQEHYRIPGVGGIVVSGRAPFLGTGLLIGAGALTLTGTTSSPRLELYARPAAGTLTWAGVSPTATVQIPGVWAPDAALLTLTGYAPRVQLELLVRPDQGTITISGLSPVTISGALRSVPAGTLTLAGLSPTVQTAQGAIIPGTGQLLLSGYSPALLRTWLAQPGVGRLSLTGVAPGVLETVQLPFTMHVQVEARDFWDPEVRDWQRWSPSVIDPEMEEV